MDAVAQDAPGMLVERFFEDEELARTAPALSSFDESVLPRDARLFKGDE